MDQPSSNSTTPWWMLLLALFGGAFIWQGGRPQPTTKDDSRASTDSGLRGSADVGADARSNRLRLPLMQFLGLREDEWREGTSLPEERRQQVYMLEFLIVTVADPQDTHVNYRFDQQVEALHRALAQEDYVPDAFYLPWQKEAKTQQYRDEPGVLLYRNARRDRATGRAALLLVYLVGETPTTGIHKQAFLAAVDQIAKLGPVFGANPKQAFVCGPTFSGSTVSLAQAIRQARDQHADLELQYRVVTGSATSVNFDRFVSRTGPQKTNDVTFHATVHAVESLERALIDHVSLASSGKIKLAWLRESGTRFGTPQRKSSMAQSDSGVLQRPVEITEFTVPLNIARVRSIYEGQRRQEESSKGGTLPDRHRLPIPFDDTGTARDLPPTQTPNMTAPADEAILGEILSIIRNEGIQYIGISMTDVRDPIFLAQLIRDQCPNSQLLLVEADLLDLHSEYRTALSGALVASSYSLFAEDQDWCFPFGDPNGPAGRTNRKVVFSNQSFYGLFNAVVLLRYLARHPDSLDVHDHQIVLPSDEAVEGESSRVPSLLAYGPPLQDVPREGGTRFDPPIWISMISPTGVMPLRSFRETDLWSGRSKARIAQEEDLPSRVPKGTNLSRLPSTLGVWVKKGEGVQFQGRHSSFNERMAPSSQFVMWGWVTAGAIYCLAVLRVVGGPWARPLWITTHSSHGPWIDHLRSAFRFVISASFTGIVLIQFALVTVVVNPPTEPSNSLARWLNLAFWTAAFAVVFVLQILAWGDLLKTLLFQPILAGRRQSNQQASFPAAATAILYGLAVVASTILIVNLFDLASSARGSLLLWYIAWTQLWNGISLLLVAQWLAAAMIVLAYGFLLQIDIAHGKSLIVEPCWPLDASGDDLNTRRDAVRRALVFPILGRKRRDKTILLPVVGCLLAACWLISLGMRTANTELFDVPLSTDAATASAFAFQRNWVTVAFVLACGFWWWRFFKTVVLAQDFETFLEKAEEGFGLEKASMESWNETLQRNRDTRFHSLQTLLSTKRPSCDDKRVLIKEQAYQAFDPNQADQLQPRQAAAKDLFAEQLLLYVRQFFHHVARLVSGLFVSGAMLFLAANGLPFNSAPLWRMTTAIMLVAIGIGLVWYYARFDRDFILSLIVGSTPHEVKIWPLLRTTLPVAGVAIIALLSQAFPEMWHWLRDVLGPLVRSSG